MGVFSHKPKGINVDLKPSKPEPLAEKKLSTFEVSGPSQASVDGTARSSVSAIGGDTVDLLETNASGQLAHIPPAHTEKPVLAVNKVAALGINMQQCQSFYSSLKTYRSCMEALSKARTDLSFALKDIKRIGTSHDEGSPDAANTPSDSGSTSTTALRHEMVMSLDNLCNILDVLSEEQCAMASRVNSTVERPLQDMIEQWVGMIEDRRTKNQQAIDEKAAQLHALEKKSYKQAKKTKMNLTAVQDSLIERVNLTNEMQALEADSSTFHDRLAASNFGRVAGMCSTSLEIEKSELAKLVKKLSDFNIVADVSSEPATIEAVSPELESQTTAKPLAAVDTPPTSRAASPEDSKAMSPSRAPPPVPAQ